MPIEINKWEQKRIERVREERRETEKYKKIMKMMIEMHFSVSVPHKNVILIWFPVAHTHTQLREWPATTNVPRDLINRKRTERKKISKRLRMGCRLCQWPGKNVMLGFFLRCSGDDHWTSHGGVKSLSWTIILCKKDAPNWVISNFGAIVFTPQLKPRKASFVHHCIFPAYDEHTE